MMSYRQKIYGLSTLLCLWTLTGCPEAQPDPPKNKTDMSQIEDMPDMSDIPDMVDQPVDLTKDMPPVEDMSDMGMSSNFPKQISTSGASFGGQLAPGQYADIELVAAKDDRVTIWLRKADDSKSLRTVDTASQ